MNEPHRSRLTTNSQQRHRSYFFKREVSQMPSDGLIYDRFMFHSSLRTALLRSATQPTPSEKHRYAALHWKTSLMTNGEMVFMFFLSVSQCFAEAYSLNIRR